MKVPSLKFRIIVSFSFFLLSCQNSPDKSYKICINEIENGNYSKALDSCKVACESGIKDGCMKEAYILDKYIKNGTNKAIKIYEELCEDGIGDACYNLGNIYEIGRESLTKDINKAVKFYKRACKDLKVNQACQKIIEMGVVSSLENINTNNEETYQPTNNEHTQYENSSEIRRTVEEYFKLVEEKRIDEAIDFYVSFKKDKIKRNIIEATAKDTEYFIVEKAEPLRFYEDKADVLVRVSQKPVYSNQVQVWEGVWTLQQEDGQWKLLKTPGKRIK